MIYGYFTPTYIKLTLPPKKIGLNIFVFIVYGIVNQRGQTEKDVLKMVFKNILQFTPFLYRTDYLITSWYHFYNMCLYFHVKYFQLLGNIYI